MLQYHRLSECHKTSPGLFLVRESKQICDEYKHIMKRQRKLYHNIHVNNLTLYLTFLGTH